jgi:hypothetical protein
MEELLLAMYCRRRNLPMRARQAFEAASYEWNPLDGPRLMFKSERNSSDPLMAGTCVLSHCSVLGPDYPPALMALSEYQRAGVGRLPPFNQRVFIYDRTPVLSRAEVVHLRKQYQVDYFLAHHAELPILLASNFTALRP